MMQNVEPQLSVLKELQKFFVQFSEDIPPNRREENMGLIVKAVDDYYAVRGEL